MPLPGGPLVASALKLAEKLSDRIIVNSWWLPEKLESVVRKMAPAGISLEFSREEEQMETAGGLALARDRRLLGSDGPVLVMNGDGIFNLDLEPLFESHFRRGDAVTMALLPHLDPEKWSRVHLDASGHVCEIRAAGRPAPGEVPLLYPGVMLVSRGALNSLECRPSGISTTLWRQALLEGKMGGVVLSGHWREIGTPAEYLEAVLSQTAGRVFCHASALIERHTEMKNCFVGRDCKIPNTCQIENSALSHGVELGEGAVIRRSVLLGPIQVPSGKTLEDVVLTPETSLAKPADIS